LTAPTFYCTEPGCGAPLTVDTRHRSTCPPDCREHGRRCERDHWVPAGADARRNGHAPKVAPPAASAEPPTWDMLSRAEPRLEELLARAYDAHETHPTGRFCANDWWFGYREWPGVEKTFQRLVGWRRRDDDVPEYLKTSDAYDLAFRTIYDALPDCRDCACIATIKCAIGIDPTTGETVGAQPRDGVCAPTNVIFRTARQIAEATPAEVEWRAEPWLKDGAITECDGKIKASGKTTFALAMMRKILDGAEFMGKPTRKSGVVCLSEQAPASFTAALRRAGLADRDDFVVLFWHDAMGVPWPEVIEAARAQARTLGFRVLLVDTLGQFAGITGDSENNAGAALEAMRPVQAAAAQDGLAVLVNRHERKSGGDVGESGRGSSAFAGAVDIVLSLRRPEGKTRPTVRVIHSLSRFDQTPPELVIELVDGEYVSHGTGQDVAAQEALENVLEALPTSEGDAIALKDICEAIKAGRRTTQRALDEHLEAGRVRCVGTGKRNDPRRFWQLVGAQTSFLGCTPTNGSETEPS
jgi:hypothetical protein